MNGTLDKLISAIHTLDGVDESVVQHITQDVMATGDFVKALLSNTKLSTDQLMQFYIDTLGLSFIDAEQLALYPIADEISLRFLRHHNVLALDESDEQIRLVTAEPYDDYPAQAIMMASGKTIDVFLAKPDVISRILEKASADGASVSELSDQLENDASFNDEDDIDRLKDLASEAPIVRLVNVIVTKAMILRASDIHIEPFEHRLRVRYRVDGVLRDVDSPPAHSTAAIISRIKIMANLNIAERRLPQDGRIQTRLQGQQIELRVSTIPSLFGESVVMRILDKEQLNLSFDRLGFGDDNTKRFSRLIKRPHGIVLVTGPTGSGKTTTLYTALSSINSANVKIMTVEDPIEYQLDGIMQLQVKPTIGLGFADALRAIVRQDPDTIMIGEMRDYETASIAIQSALTGHLVFSTLHTNDAGSAITRLLDMGVEDYLITSTVAGIVAQRLVRTLCQSCKKTVKPSQDIINEFSLDQYGFTELALFEPVGCTECNDSGYFGRTVILEQMNMDESLRTKVLARSDGATIQAQAISNGMRTMRGDGIAKALAGITSLEEVISATQEV